MTAAQMLKHYEDDGNVSIVVNSAGDMFMICAACGSSWSLKLSASESKLDEQSVKGFLAGDKEVMANLGL